MKNKYIFCFLLLITIRLQSMESEVSRSETEASTSETSEEISEAERLSVWQTAENKLAYKYKSFLEDNYHNYNNNCRLDPDDLISNGKKFGLPKRTITEVIKTARFKNGNTFIHFFAMFKKREELIKLANQNLLFFEENKKGVTPFDIAFYNFSNLTEKEKLKEQCEERCIYLILSNYLKIKDDADYKKEIQDYTDNKKLIWCCDIHSRNSY